MPGPLDDPRFADPSKLSVHLHAWHRLPDGGQEHTNDPDLTDGWSTYVRMETPDDPQQPFDIGFEADHDTYADAELRASMLAVVIHNDPDEYEED